MLPRKNLVAESERGGTHSVERAIQLCYSLGPVRAIGLREGSMGPPSVHEITQLLRAWSAGDEEALDQLTPLVYRELHRAAQRYMARQLVPDHTLQTTALVNEVYLRLVAFKEVSWADRAHFFAVCAQLMRRILTDLGPQPTIPEAGLGSSTSSVLTRRWSYPLSAVPTWSHWTRQ